MQHILYPCVSHKQTFKYIIPHIPQLPAQQPLHILLDRRPAAAHHHAAHDRLHHLHGAAQHGAPGERGGRQRGCGGGPPAAAHRGDGIRRQRADMTFPRHARSGGGTLFADRVRPILCGVRAPEPAARLVGRTLSLEVMRMAYIRSDIFMQFYLFKLVYQT